MNAIWSFLFLVAAVNVALTSRLPIPSDTMCNNEISSGRSYKIVPYIVEITRKFMKFQTFGCDPLEVPLTETESEEIQKLSFEFVKLLDSSKISSSDDAEVLDWKVLNPIILLTNTEISIRFVKMTPGSGSGGENGKRFVYWKFLTEYAKNVFENKLKELNVTVQDGGPEFEFQSEESTDDVKNFQVFIDTLWKIMKISVNYAEDNSEEWTKLSSEVLSSSRQGTPEPLSLIPKSAVAKDQYASSQTNLPSPSLSSTSTSTSLDPNLTSI